MLTPILQFGTSRFLQAHADLFISEALERGDALGPIAVVQTTDNPSSHARVTALAAGGGYPVQIRGRQNGQIVDMEQRCTGIRAAYHAGQDWAVLRRIITGEVQVILSNTGDAGYALHPADGPSLLLPGADAPRSFPAKLLVLLHDRWQAGAPPLAVFPCELISRNGDTLRGIVQNLALTWGAAAGFSAWLAEGCRWANSLVDRIVSKPIEPVGAVAEPYALWAIEAQAGLTLPCRHPALQIVPDLAVIERLKLHLLNLGHTYLADGWLRQARAAGETVFQAMETPTIRADLEAMWTEEVLPVFVAWGLATEATEYLTTVRDRFLNPFLKHRLADIAQNHADKRLRRLVPIIDAATAQGLALPQARLRAALM